MLRVGAGEVHLPGDRASVAGEDLGRRHHRRRVDSPHARHHRNAELAHGRKDGLGPGAHSRVGNADCVQHRTRFLEQGHPRGRKPRSRVDGERLDDDGAEFDYFELKAAGGHDFTEQFNAGLAAYYAPENFGDTGDALYLEVNAAYQISEAFAINGAYGNQNIEEPNGPSSEDDYNTWNVGAAWATHGFQVDLRYHDSDIDEGTDIANYAYGESSHDSAFVVTIGREL